jgi:hypothetical protein
MRQIRRLTQAPINRTAIISLTLQLVPFFHNHTWMTRTNLEEGDATFLGQPDCPTLRCRTHVAGHNPNKNRALGCRVGFMG